MKKLRLDKKKIQVFVKVVIFVCFAILIVQLFPGDNKLNYKFEVGKPWTYDLMTAAFDFPIYKDAKDIDKESKELLKKFIPYYYLDTATHNIQMDKLKQNLENAPTQIKNFIITEFENIYNAGLISADDINKLNRDGKKEINCIYPNRQSRVLSVKSLLTPKSAYEEILKKAPELSNQLNGYNLNLFLSENLKYDSIASEGSKKELLKNLSLTVGLVQTGEKIIDRGEIVTPETYAILNSLKLEYEKRNVNTQQSFLTKLGKTILVLGFVLLLFLYIYVFRPKIFNKTKNILLILLMILLIIASASLIICYTSFNYYVVPYALLPIIIRVFFDSRTALFSHIITILTVSLIVNNPFYFIVLQITAGMTAVSNLKDLTQRSQLAQTALYVFLCYSIIFLGLEFVAEGELSRINWIMFIYFTISSMLLLFAYIFIFFIEKAFHKVSSMTLVELTNINSDFMINFAEVAPGTFQHTLQVSNLATEAAKKINANALLVRTGALYHDIGKILHPEYFTENQAGGNNPLLQMSFEDAAKVIINHVRDGIQLGKKKHLPEQIINFIATHHGTSKTRYFYNAFINANPGVEPNNPAFTYPGPRPNTKETAILMMADAVEARSRSLKEYTEESIDYMVEDMIDSQIADGQFKDAPISFLDVENVKAVFKEKVKNIYHTRITYPDVKKES